METVLPVRAVRDWKRASSDRRKENSDIREKQEEEVQGPLLLA
jgi:hypothetical protein